MPDYEKLVTNLTRRGYTVQRFPTARQAADYLDSVIDQTSVAFGGSVTLDQMGLYDRLAAHNNVIWHWKTEDKLTARYQAMTTDMYITSVNGLAETGELINIDGIGNRVAATLFGHKKVWFVVGRNKLAPTYDEAQKRPKASKKDPLCHQGGPLLRLQEPGPHLPGAGGSLGSRHKHGNGGRPHR